MPYFWAIDTILSMSGGPLWIGGEDLSAAGSPITSSAKYFSKPAGL
jgi:hypothetical protein